MPMTAEQIVAACGMLESIADLIRGEVADLPDDARAIRVERLFCAHCTATFEGLEAARAHDQQCAANPLVARIAELERELAQARIPPVQRRTANDLISLLAEHKDAEIYDLHVARLLHFKVVARLDSAGITTIGALTRRTAMDLVCLQGIGGRVDEVRRALDALGLRLAGE